ncbi:MAG TPA: hypothetical protein VJ617_11555 [Arthrobacter sp.]|nr:hypothetical protein [Arthrobacter sp.]
MKRLPSVLRAMPATAGAAVLALSAGLWAVPPANAETSDPTPTCVLICLPGQSGPDPENPRTPRPEPTSQEPSAPAPAPPAPPLPAEPAPAPDPALAPEPGDAAVEETPPAEATTSVPATAASTSAASTESNWNQPITKSAKPTQAAAASTGDGPGLGDPGLVTIFVGVLLMGLGGLAFAWWGRNRVSAH